MDDKPHSTTAIGCVEISIDNDAAGWWTAQQVYDYLTPEALNLDLQTNGLAGGGELFIEVRSDMTYHYTSAEVGYRLPAGCNAGGHYATCTEVDVITLIADPQRHMFVAPGFELPGYEHSAEPAIAHEYGHAWTFYWADMAHGGDWSSYITERGITTDPYWEVAAEDYRMCFGSYWAINGVDRSYPAEGKPTQADCDWLATVWRPA